jgi:hypothetical protein
MGLRQVLRHVSQSESRYCCGHDLLELVEDELAFDTHVQLATVFFEFPRKQAPVSWQPQIDAVVAVVSMKPAQAT